MEPENTSDLSFAKIFNRILRSIFPYRLIPKTDQERKRYLIKSLILHFRPPLVAAKTLRLSLTWGLGGMAVMLILLQFGTGILLKFVYVPTPAGAYASVLVLQNEVMFGQLIRNMHHWCANFLVLIVCLHMLRVFFTGAFHFPRQFNWIIGWGLFGLVLTANFTGYLLPYDQLSYWAVTVSTSMLEYMPYIGERIQHVVRGGSDIGPQTLTIFYAFHTAIVPTGFIILMGFHFWRIRKAGGLVVPRAVQDTIEKKPLQVPVMPNLLVREVVMALVLSAFVLMFAMLFNVPLEKSANPGLSPNPTKAPWYFVGFQEILMHFHPFFAVFIIPVLMITGLFWIPYFRYQSNSAGIWFASLTGRKMARIAAFTGAAATSALILADEFIIDKNGWMSNSPAVIGTGVIPLAGILAAGAGFYIFMKRRYAAANNEAIQAVFVLVLAAFLILTVTGVWLGDPEWLYHGLFNRNQR
jgi:quinol-cytochrome oxidoreductase complex cytochrome b subunit